MGEVVVVTTVGQRREAGPSRRGTATLSRPDWRVVPWVLLPIAGLLLMDVLGLFWVGVLVPAAALVLAVAQRHRPPVGVRWLALRRYDAGGSQVIRSRPAPWL
jgi:hypothetical protein